MTTTRRTHMRRALACVAAAACCVVGVSSSLSIFLCMGVRGRG